MDVISKDPSPKFSKPVFPSLLISMLAVVSTALAVMLYHLVAVRYCMRRQRITTTAGHQQPPPQDPTPTTGVEDKVLQTIPILPYSEKENQFFRADQSECVVCLGKLEEGEMVRLLPGCRHAFHVSCVDQWFDGHASCPMCRAPVVASLPPMAVPFPTTPCADEGNSIGTRPQNRGQESVMVDDDQIRERMVDDHQIRERVVIRPHENPDLESVMVDDPNDVSTCSDQIRETVVIRPRNRGQECPMAGDLVNASSTCVDERVVLGPLNGDRESVMVNDLSNASTWLGRSKERVVLRSPNRVNKSVMVDDTNKTSTGANQIRESEMVGDLTNDSSICVHGKRGERGEREMVDDDVSSTALLRHSAMLVTPEESRRVRVLAKGLKGSLSDHSFFIMDIQCENEGDCPSSSSTSSFSSSNVDLTSIRSSKERSVRHFDLVSSKLLRSLSRLRKTNGGILLPY